VTRSRINKSFNRGYQAECINAKQQKKQKKDQFELLIQGFIVNQYGISSDLFTRSTIVDLREKLVQLTKPIRHFTTGWQNRIFQKLLAGARSVALHDQKHNEHSWLA